MQNWVQNDHYYFDMAIAKYAIFFWPYLNHFKSDFDGVKSKVGLWFNQLVGLN